MDILYPSYEYSLDKVKCHHGGFSIPTPGFIRMVQGPFYGPDCTIVAKKGNGASVVFRAQQNYCFLEAGDITVWIVDKSNAGGMNYSKREGSFGDSRPGEIGMNGFF
ncbi:MAG: hypothetical protein KZQ66_10290 [Candidatus Thiodiazotropha sp. (ex Lucinoma aequizonata)]|nr:hypothetical protein [Candidatus Thiodiazotropha sp. (ex Lucinoma aequizonata)]MCU7888015.1 hypothetical protein [Candidatus Thiodiazotropha sp. (ex Lucinoma aequizonata)]MCU7895229.1 hypothetical protein [Candidatus Thiodiazotropha sp. (ex Lucinoma aequizonata)]MCU7897968.1 hypothetical protein [Candidatus Thiodiazotropha sp. (ex Lucinoma aequizonata)]MCU7902327.1 hypothetical protein [Candidatus Thiodiazotropha sp. (ex Lucinoma aequizonata)]